MIDNEFQFLYLDFITNSLWTYGQNLQNQPLINGKIKF